MAPVEEPSTTQGVAAVPVKDENATLDVVQGRLEELLSKQSLTEDAFIQQNMNAQMYIPIAILASHNALANLGVDMGILLAAARRSDKLGVDEENLSVKPLLKHRRNTLILHDLPEGILEDELRALFDSCTEKESLTLVKPDVNRTAYVTFKTDESAQTAALWLRSQKLRGASIKCAVKSEHLVRSFFPAAPPSTAMPQYMMQGDQIMWGTPPWMSGGAPQQYQQWQEQWTEQGMQENWGQQGDAMHDGSMPAASPGGFKGVDYSKGGEFAKGVGKDSKAKGKGKIKGKKGKGGGYMTPSSEYGATMSGTEFMGMSSGEMQMEMVVQDESLPAAAMEEALGVDASSSVGGAQVPGEEELDIGYTHQYRKYSRQQIIEVCNNMDEIVKPESYARFEEEHPDGQALFRQSPCKDWAPLPTPQMPFRASDEFGEGFDRRPSRKASGSAWTRSSRTMSTGSGGGGGSADAQEDGDWGESWTEGGGRWRKRGSSWADRSWPEEAQEGTGWYWPEHAGEGEGGGGGKGRSRRPRSRSASRTKWAEKGKSESAWGKGWPSESGPKWAVKKPPEANDDTIEPGASDAATAGPDQKSSEPSINAETATEDNTATAAASNEPAGGEGVEGAVDKKPSWADKVRQGKASPKSSPASPPTSGK